MPTFHNLVGTTSEDFSLGKSTKRVNVRTNNGVMEIKNNGGSYRPVQRKITISASAPTVNDDGTAGYIIGDFWFISTNAYLYVCEAITTGAAVWTQVSGTGGSGSGVTDEQAIAYAMTFGG